LNFFSIVSARTLVLRASYSSVLVARALIASVTRGEGLSDSVGLSIPDALAGLLGTRHLHVRAAGASVATVRGGDGLSWLEFLVVECAFAFSLRASDLAVLITDASVALNVERLTEPKVLSVVDAFADLVLSDDFAILTEVFLALVRRFPDGASHSQRAERLRHVGSAVRSCRRALKRNVTFHLFADFADARAAVVLGEECLTDVVCVAVVGTFLFRLALRRVAVNFGNASNLCASTLASRFVEVLEFCINFVAGAAILAKVVSFLG
jgi:hypothetical protein